MPHTQVRHTDRQVGGGAEEARKHHKSCHMLPRGVLEPTGAWRQSRATSTLSTNVGRPVTTLTGSSKCRDPRPRIHSATPQGHSDPSQALDTWVHLRCASPTWNL